MIDRAEMKRMARSSMQGRKPSVYLVALIVIVITWVLSNLYTTIQLRNFDYEDFVYSVMYGMELPMRSIGPWGTLITLALNLMSIVISAGFTWYCMKVSRGEDAGIGEVFDAFGIFFKVIWLSIVSGVFVFLWSLLFVVPGIVAAYRYSMALYILLDDPEKGALQCIRESKEMTRGYKGKLFVLDLSFIGWAILCAIPFVSVFVNPYITITKANYYNHLSGWQPGAGPAVEYDYREPWEK